MAEKTGAGDAPPSKLERLLRLLHEGGSRHVRELAGERIAGLIHASQGQNILNLLNKVKPLLYDRRRLDTRTAAAFCLEKVAERCMREFGVGSPSNARADVDAFRENAHLRALMDEMCLSFKDLDLDKVFKLGTPLLACSEDAYNVEEYEAELTDGEKLKSARERLDKNIGLSGGMTFFDSSEIVSNQDLLCDDVVKKFDRDAAHMDANALLPSRKRQKVKVEEKGDASLMDSVLDQDGGARDELSVINCFEICSRDFGAHLFDENWEVRHGAAMGLRALFVTLEQRLFAEHRTAARENPWYVDFGVRLVCLLALDRLGDFFGSTSAPVKEAAAQTLGYIAKHLKEDSMGMLVGLLCRLMAHSEWHVQHGGLLGFRFVFLGCSVRRQVMDGHNVFKLIGDLLAKETDDDVFSAAVENIITFMEHLPLSEVPCKEMQAIHTKMWDLLPGLEELHASISTCLKILKLMSGVEEYDVPFKYENRLSIMSQLCCHPSPGIRLQAVDAFGAILGTLIKDGVFRNLSTDFWLRQCRFIVELALVEQNADVIERVLILFEVIVREANFKPKDGVMKHMDKLMALAQMPDFRVLGPRDLSCHSQLESLHLFAATTRVTKKGKAGKSERRSTALALGYVDRPPMCVRMDVARFFAVMLYHLEDRTAFIGRLTKMLETPSFYSQVLSMLVVKSALTYGDGLALTPPLAEALARSTGSAKFACTLSNVGSLFNETASDAKDVTTALGSFEDIVGMSKDQYTNIALNELLPLASGALNGIDDPNRQEAAFFLISALDKLEASVGLMALRLRSAWAGATVSSKGLPPKLNAIIQPLMESIRTEQHERLQRACARSLAELMFLCQDRTPSPNVKLIKNVFGRVSLNTATASRSTLFDEDSALQKGALATLEEIVNVFGSSLQLKVPSFVSHLTSHVPMVGSPESLGNLVKIKLLSKVMPTLYDVLSCHVLNIAKAVTWAEPSHDGQGLLSYAASCCLVELSVIKLGHILDVVFKELIPHFKTLGGCTQAILQVLEFLELFADRHGAGLSEVIPFVLVKIVPLTSSQEESVRKAAAQAFAKLFPFYAVGVSHTSDQLPSCLHGFDSASIEDAKALQRIFNASSIDHYPLPFEVDVQLRPYQQEGLNWLRFLQRFGLNGVLADDMGLGKTLQALLIMGASMREAALGGAQPKPKCVIVCPSTLVSHWVHEAERYIPGEILKAFGYAGTPKERAALQRTAFQHGGNCLVTSYSVVQKDVDWLQGHRFQYCILDEGHVIKNPTTATAKACRAIKANHRLILSGTPIQNDVLEVWSLFEFLMPGFLGSRKEFAAKYRGAVNAGKREGANKKDREGGILIADQLGKQISPFVLRRTKKAVLKELPAKIIQDMVLEMSPSQRRMYEQVAQEGGGTSDEGLLRIGGGPAGGAQGATSSFLDRAARLRRICSVGQPGEEAPKMAALKQILEAGGVIQSGADAEAPGAGAEEEEPRQVLVFAQSPGTLDAIASTVLTPNGVPFLRIDGGVSPSERHGVALRFQSDPTFPVMLLTTRVGGLGLNLTAADTVVFVEHDWNPQQDLQAMDRAHRLGQTKTVNVYRLIMKDSFEQRVMSLQRWKLSVAEVVVPGAGRDGEGAAAAGAGALDVLAKAPGGGEEAGDELAQRDDTAFRLGKRKQGDV